MSGTVVVPNNDPAAIGSGNSWNGLDTTGAPVIVTLFLPVTSSRLCSRTICRIERTDE
jgi:hypothetical protein